jgi:hypothetical protein
MNLPRFSLLTCVCVSAALIGLPLVGSTANADPIMPGYDYLLTPPGGAVLTHPMLGVVPMVGKPIQGTLVDTIIQRYDGLPPGGIGPIDAEIVALSLQSIAPVAVPMGSGSANVYVTIDKGAQWLVTPPSGPLPASTGTITITSHADGPPGSGGGSFNSFFDVFAWVTLEDVMGGTLFSGPAPPDMITSTGSTWTHDAAWHPSMGNWAPGPIFHTGPHPHTQPVPPESPLPTPVPEPGSALLAVCAILGCGFVRRRNG